MITYSCCSDLLTKSVQHEARISGLASSALSEGTSRDVEKLNRRKCRKISVSSEYCVRVERHRLSTAEMLLGYLRRYFCEIGVMKKPSNEVTLSQQGRGKKPSCMRII